MEKSFPSSITVEEAVAEMVNMDYIPAGFTLLSMIEAFQVEAEIEYENARIDRLPEDQIAPLKIRMESCRARHTLAQLLLESLQYEVDHPERSVIVLANNSLSMQRLTFESVWYWAADRYGIGISRVTQDSNKVDETLKNIYWEDVTIKIWADYKIGYSLKKGKCHRSHFRTIGLMGNIKKIPNHLGGILIGLSQNRIFPTGGCQSKDKTAISKLRGVLYKWIGLPDDPFIRYNQSEGWLPRFRLIYNVNNADERAEKNAIHISFDETRLYDHDDQDD